MKMLEHYLKKYDLTILIDAEDSNKLADLICNSKAMAGTSKRVVIISKAGYPTKPGNHIYVTVSEKEMKSYLEIYRSYESSDKLVLLSDRNANYGSMFNYVNAGILTTEEMVEAVLA